MLEYNRMESTITPAFWVQEWQLVTLAVLITALVTYTRGTKKLPRLQKKRRVSFYVAIFVTTLVLASPLHRLGTILFSARVAQHILLMALIPCLFTYSDPIPALAAGLPVALKKRFASLARRAWAQRGSQFFKASTTPGIVFILATVSFWIWYDPTIHHLTIRYSSLHTFETAWLLFVALLYWWHILGAFPYVHPPIPPLIRVMYTIVGTWPIKVVGLILMVSNQSIYQYPQSFQVGNLNINDQGVGAILVWMLGGVVFSTTATLLMRDWLKGEADKPIDPSPAWQTDRGMRAPGFPRA